MIFRAYSSSPASVTEFYQQTVMQAEHKGRVKTSHLTKLLKKVSNCHEKLSLENFRKVQDYTHKLKSILTKQNSKLLAVKSNQINKALEQIETKLSTDATKQRVAEVKEVLNHSVTIIASIHSKLVNKITVYQTNINGTIACLPNKESRKAAIAILNKQSYSDFSPESAITQKLFPEMYRRIDVKYGHQKICKQDHPAKSVWISLEHKSRDLHATLEKEYLAYTLLDRENEILNVSGDDLGRVELTPLQKKAIEFASGLAPFQISQSA